MADTSSSQETRVDLFITARDGVTDVLDKITLKTRSMAAAVNGAVQGTGAAIGRDLANVETTAQRTERVLRQMLEESARARAAAERAGGGGGSTRPLPQLVHPAVAAQRVDQGREREQLQSRIAYLAQASQFDSTRERALERLSQLESGINKVLQTEGLSTQRRVQLETALSSIKQTQVATEQRISAAMAEQTRRAAEAQRIRSGGRDRAQLQNNIALLTRQTQFDSTRARAIERLTTLERALTNALNQSNLSTARAVQLEESLRSVRAALGSTTAATVGHLDVAGKKTLSLGGMFDLLKTKGVGAMMALQAAAAALGVALGAGATLTFIGKANVEFQKLLTQVRTFSGSEFAAREVFEELRHFATTTPFELQGVVRAFITLRSAGIQPTEEMLRSFGDFASSFGADINDFAESVRSATTGEMERLKQFGIVARLEGDKIHASFNGVTTTIGRDARSIVTYLDGISKANFAGAMEREMKTLGGALSNLQDAVWNLAVSFGEAGLTESMTNATASLTDFTTSISDNAEEIRDWVRLILAIGNALLQTVVAPLRLLTNFIHTIFSTLNIAFQEFTKVLFAAGNVVLSTLATIKEAITGTSATYLRTLEESYRAYYDRAVASQNASTAAIMQNGTDVINSIKNVGEAYYDLAVTVSTETVRMTEAEKKHQEQLRTTSKQQRDYIRARGELIADETKKTQDRKKAIEELRALEMQLAGEFNDSATPQFRRDAITMLLNQLNLAKAGRLSSAPGGTTGPADKKDELKEEIKMLGDAMESEATRAAAQVRLIDIEKKLETQLTRGSLTLEKRAAIVEKINAIDDVFAKHTQRIIKATEIEQTRGDALLELRDIEDRLRTMLARTDLTLERRINVYEQLGSIEEARQKAFTEHLSVLKDALEYEQTREQAIAGLVLMERALTERLRAGNLRYDERVRLLKQLSDVQKVVGDADPDKPAEIDTQNQKKSLDILIGVPAPNVLSEQIQKSVDAATKDVTAQIEIEFPHGNAIKALQELQQAFVRGNNDAERLHNTIIGISRTLAEGFRQGVMDAFEALATGSMNAAQAFASAMIGALAQVAQQFGDFFMAKAIGALMDAILGLNPSGAAAAAGYIAAAGAMYAIAGAMSGAAKSASGGGGGASSNGFADGKNIDDASKGTAVVIWEGEKFDPRDPEQLERFNKMREEVGNRRIVMRERGARRGK